MNDETNQRRAADMHKTVQKSHLRLCFLVGIPFSAFISSFVHQETLGIITFIATFVSIVAFAEYIDKPIK